MSTNRDRIFHVPKGHPVVRLLLSIKSDTINTKSSTLYRKQQNPIERKPRNIFHKSYRMYIIVI